MLSCMDSVERMCHAAARMRYHHDRVTRTIAVRVRGLQGSRERWTAPTILDGPDVVGILRCKEVESKSCVRVCGVYMGPGPPPLEGRRPGPHGALLVLPSYRAASRACPTCYLFFFWLGVSS